MLDYRIIDIYRTIFATSYTNSVTAIHLIYIGMLTYEDIDVSTFSCALITDL